ncbi:hypothetical protein BE04_21375 [Sorangium cellulosum]|uniref:Uncharacterized protein n=1 Tax=Sorangium cellulosum TaxID=56 RepID=A0A150P2V6_SORCE|nr:hypothetical protein BE04_21375 [Sorangium cellulosum]
MEEDRVPSSERSAFHARLTSSTSRLARARLAEAARAAPRVLTVPSPRPPAIQGDWWHHVTLKALQGYKYLSRAVKRSRPPPRVSLARPIGQSASGAGVSVWITRSTGADADDLRHRLGLCTIKSGNHLYRIRMAVSAAPSRPLYIPTALDAGWYPAWRRPDAGHNAPWGLTRHLRTDAPSEPELLVLPDTADAREARYVGEVRTAPPRGYLAKRRLP